MIVISSREFRENQKKYFDLARIQRVIIKRRNQFLELVSHGDSIPESVSPSNDPYFDDPRNIEEILKASEEAKNGKGITFTSTEQIKEFFDKL